MITATQELILLPNLLDLCNIIIVHRFALSVYFKMLKGHLADTVNEISNSKKSKYTLENLFL